MSTQPSSFHCGCRLPRGRRERQACDGRGRPAADFSPTPSRPLAAIDVSSPCRSLRFSRNPLRQGVGKLGRRPGDSPAVTCMDQATGRRSGSLDVRRGQSRNRKPPARTGEQARPSAGGVDQNESADPSSFSGQEQLNVSNIWRQRRSGMRTPDGLDGHVRVGAAGASVQGRRRRIQKR